ncbi:hypothetical protein FNF31_07068 [Cafeteria roenbergensis]|uniref:Uncharacterized protein n=3 Tax=Cafeteria roenbergensis TaxID=33653 RepID=A0A5A8CDW7_CAFRO|nr:hypothetical protein FNF31_07068 [Cafeteria roenbergensis]KAA0161854.1 hypothetical protein FNF28_04919 [Cafeteria roenbergensis]
MPSTSAIGVLNGSYEEQDLLQAWLLVVASLRALSVFLGYFAPMQMLPRVFSGIWSGKEKEDDAPSKTVSGLTARTFAVWTTVTCIVTATCALSLDNKTVVALTASSFATVLCFFGLELALYRTMKFGSIVTPGIIASVSVGWLARHYLAMA